MRVVLFWLVVLLGWLFAFGEAFAQGATVPAGYPSLYNNNFESEPKYSSIDAACQGGMAYWSNLQGASYVVYGWSDATDCVIWQDGAYWSKTTISVGGPYTSTTPKCPSGSTLNSGGSCTCTSGFSDGATCTNGQRTDAYCQGLGASLGGTTDGSKYSITGGSSTVCQGGCMGVPEMSYGSGSDRWGSGPIANIGKACPLQTNPDGSQTVAPSPVTDPAASVCKEPTACPGTFNGTSLCVPCGTEGTNKVSTTTSTPAGASAPASTSTTVTTKETAPDGTTTTVKTTTNPDGSVTRTVTAGGAPVAGAAASGAASSDPLQSFCKDNPQSAFCKQSSFAGTCGVAFTCDGDAVQCAIAKEQHVRNCAFFDPASVNPDAQAHVDRFSQARQDGDVPSWSPAASGAAGSTSIDFASGLSMESSWSATCPADQTLFGSGATAVVVPWSKFCDSWVLIGRLVLAVTFIGCCFIVFK